MRTPFVAVLAALAALAVPATASAYLVKRTANGSPIRWQRARVSVSVHASLAAQAGPDSARRAATIAADAWRGFGAPDLELAPGVDGAPYRAGAPGTQLAVLEPWPHAPHLLAVTATSYQESDGAIVDADVLLNPAHELVLIDEGAPRFDLGAVLTHELGHALGLGESEADPMATMWPRIRRGDTHQRTLADDDVDGLAEAYRGARLAPIGGCGGARVALGTGSARIVPWLLAVIVGALVLVLAWRRRNTDGAARRGRPSVGRPAGLVFAGAALLLALPEGLVDSAPSEPVAVRAARVLSARELPALERAARLRAALSDHEPLVRSSALEVVLADPRREDHAIAGPLTEDSDARVASLARAALAAARVAPPSEVIDVDATIAAGFAEAVQGEVRVVGVARGADGIARTRVEVSGVEVDVLGGCLDGVCTDVGESLPPRAGEALLVAPSGAWARVRGELAYDGWIDEGVSVRGLAR